MTNIPRRAIKRFIKFLGAQNFHQLRRTFFLFQFVSHQIGNFYGLLRAREADFLESNALSSVSNTFSLLITGKIPRALKSFKGFANRFI